MSHTYRKTPRLQAIREDDDEEVDEPYYGKDTIFYKVFGVHRQSELNENQKKEISKIQSKSKQKKNCPECQKSRGGRKHLKKSGAKKTVKKHRKRTRTRKH